MLLETHLSRKKRISLILRNLFFSRKMHSGKNISIYLINRVFGLTVVLNMIDERFSNLATQSRKISHSQRHREGSIVGLRRKLQVHGTRKSIFLSPYVRNNENPPNVRISDGVEYFFDQSWPVKEKCLTIPLDQFVLWGPPMNQWSMHPTQFLRVVIYSTTKKEPCYWYRPLGYPRGTNEYAGLIPDLTRMIRAVQ